jgi:hypothetical protein
MLVEARQKGGHAGCGQSLKLCPTCCPPVRQAKIQELKGSLLVAGRQSKGGQELNVRRHVMRYAGNFAAPPGLWKCFWIRVTGRHLLLKPPARNNRARAMNVKVLISHSHRTGAAIQCLVRQGRAWLCMSHFNVTFPLAARSMHVSMRHASVQASTSPRTEHNAPPHRPAAHM